ncbi:MAG: hypothetical protein MHPSP_001616, partial [Paramarteilia canceri]
VEIKKSNFIGSEVKFRDDHMPRVHVALAVEGAKWTDTRLIPLLISTVLIGSHEKGAAIGAGANLASHFARNCVEENLCDSFQAFNSQYKDTGLWGIYFITERLKVEKMVQHVAREWSRLSSSISENELKRGKALLKTQYMMGLSTTQSLFDESSRQILYHGRRIYFQEFAAKIDKLTMNEFKAAMVDFIDEKDIALAAIGPTEGIPEYIRICNMMRSYLS